METNISGAKRLLTVSKKYGLKKNVFMSSMSAHKNAVSTYGRQKLAIEKLFAKQKSVNLRSGLIIGNGGIVKNMAAFMKSKHAVPLIDGGKQPLQVIGVYDLARVIERVLTQPRLTGTYTVATPQVYSYKEFYKAISTQLHIKVLFVPVPFNLLLFCIRIITKLHLPLSVNEDNLWGLKKLQAVDNQADLDKLGVTIDPLETALRKAKIN
jgi:nucleoside-diphosphate-sugar epimerase